MSGSFVEYAGNSIQLLLGAVFLAAAAPKLRHPYGFVVALRGYELVPSMVSAPVAGGLVASEAFVGISLLSGWALAVGLSVAGGLVATFAIGVGINLRRRRDIACGCFGSDSERISMRTLARIGLLIAAVAVLASIRFVANPAPMNAASLIADGSRALERLMFTAAFAALLAILATWALHLPEMGVLVRRARG
jgi:hypothetical protein